RRESSLTRPRTRCDGQNGSNWRTAEDLRRREIPSAECKSRARAGPASEHSRRATSLVKSSCIASFERRECSLARPRTRCDGQNGCTWRPAEILEDERYLQPKARAGQAQGSQANALGALPR